MSARASKPVQGLAYRDTRTAGQRRADAYNWAHPPHRPLTRVTDEPRRLRFNVWAWLFWLWIAAWCIAAAAAIAGWL